MIVKGIFLKSGVLKALDETPNGLLGCVMGFG